MFAAYLSLLRTNRNFRLLWAAQIVSELADWFYSLAVYNLLLDLTGSKAQAVGLAVVFQVLPSALAAPTAGVLNDRISRKRIMIGADIARFFVVLGMLAVRTSGMVWLVYPLLFIETIGMAFFEPAHSSVIPNIVPEDRVLTANALSSITWSFCLAAGASLGGVVAALLGRDAVFLLNAVSFLASAWLIRGMRFDEPHTDGATPFRGRELVTFQPILEGIRHIRSDRRLLATVFVKGGLGIIGANNVLLPILGERVYRVKLAGLDHSRQALLGMSMLMGARGGGALLGPLVGGAWARHREGRMRAGILMGFVLAAVCYVALGFSNSMAVAIGAVILAHAGTSTNWVFSTTLLQIYTGDRFRGRVFSADYGLCMLAVSASSYLAGVAIDMGVAPRTFAMGLGLAMLVPAAGWAMALRATERRGEANALQR
jgi:predicted MFS family arabinose efflux permease